MRGVRCRVVAIALAAGAAWACGRVSNDAADADLRLAQTRWSRSGVQDYSVVVRYSCFLRARDICPYTSPVRMTVRSGNVVSRVDADTQQPAPQPATRIRHVQGLLDLIREAIDRHAYRIVVSYDSTYGYPALIDINYLENGLDDEIQITVTDFRPLR